MRGAHLLLGGLVLVVLGCGSEGTSPPTVATITLTPATFDTLFSLGETFQLSAVPKDGSGATVSGATVSFQSSAQNVATVTADGLVTAVANGTATVTATSGSATASATVRVRQKLARVTVLPATPGVAVGRTVTLSASGMDARGNGVSGLPTATFVSDNANTASVDGAGVVTGRTVGSATITASIASAADGTRTGTATVNVTTAPPLTATVTMGATTFTPNSTEIAVGGTVTWVNSSSDSHDVDFGNPAMKIPVFPGGQQRSLTFAAAGSFAYFCTLHAGMTGTVVVR
jgi:plastocyanin